MDTRYKLRTDLNWTKPLWFIVLSVFLFVFGSKAGKFRPGSDIDPFFWCHLAFLEEKTQNVPSLRANISINSRYIKKFYFNNKCNKCSSIDKIGYLILKYYIYCRIVVNTNPKYDFYKLNISVNCKILCAPD